MLHGPYGEYEDLLKSETESPPTDMAIQERTNETGAFPELSRGITLTSGMKMAEIFSFYAQKFGKIEPSLFSVHQISLATVSLMACISVTKDSGQRSAALQSLQILDDILRDVSTTHRPALSMLIVVDHILERYRGDSARSEMAGVCPDAAPPVTTWNASSPSVPDYSSDTQAEKRRRLTSGQIDSVRYSTEPGEEHWTQLLPQGLQLDPVKAFQGADFGVQAYCIPSYLDSNGDQDVFAGSGLSVMGQDSFLCSPMQDSNYGSNMSYISHGDVFSESMQW